MSEKPTYEELEQRIQELEQAESERNQGGEALRESEEKFRSTLESISDGFFILETESLIVTYFNKPSEELLGRKAKDVLKKPLFDAFPEARGSIFEKKYKEAFKSKEFCTFETYFGEEPYRNWYDVRVYPGQESISVFFHVTTERKQAEEALRESEEKYQVQRWI